MIGYNKFCKTLREGGEFSHIFVYVDACPWLPNLQSLPAGVIIIEPTDGIDTTFLSFEHQVVHLIGGNEQRVRAFAERIFEFFPKQLIANWGEAMEIIE